MIWSSAVRDEVADFVVLIDLHWSEEDQMYCDASIDTWGMHF